MRDRARKSRIACSVVSAMKTDGKNLCQVRLVHNQIVSQRKRTLRVVSCNRVPASRQYPRKPNQWAVSECGAYNLLRRPASEVGSTFLVDFIPCPCLLLALRKLFDWHVLLIPSLFPCSNNPQVARLKRMSKARANPICKPDIKQNPETSILPALYYYELMEIQNQGSERNQSCKLLNRKD